MNVLRDYSSLLMGKGVPWFLTCVAVLGALAGFIALVLIFIIRCVGKAIGGVIGRRRRQPPSVSRQFPPIPTNIWWLTPITSRHFVSLKPWGSGDISPSDGAGTEPSSNAGPRLVFPWPQLGAASSCPFHISLRFACLVWKTGNYAAVLLEPVLRTFNLSDALTFTSIDSVCRLSHNVLVAVWSWRSP